MPGKLGQARNENLAARIDFVRDLLASCCTKSTIKRLVRDEFGDLHHSTIEDYIRRAREARDIDAERGRREKRNEQVDFYRRMMRTAELDRDKIRAAERYDKLNGLERNKLALTGPGGGPIQVTDVSEMSDEDLAEIAAGRQPSRGRRRDSSAPTGSSRRSATA